jgi:hypothetical protein
MTENSGLVVAGGLAATVGVLNAEPPMIWVPWSCRA